MNVGLPQDAKYWYRSKTLWAGVATIVGSAAAGFTQVASPVEAVQGVVAGFLAIFLRQGAGTALVKKNGS